MGLFDFFKKNRQPRPDPAEALAQMQAFSTQPLDSAADSIAQHGTFLPFGLVYTREKELQMIVYHDPSQTSVDPREHAIIIQKLLAKRYENPDTLLCHMAFDGIAHLPGGDCDAICVRVSHKAAGLHRMYAYPYKVENGAVRLLDRDNPVVTTV